MKKRLLCLMAFVAVLCTANAQKTGTSVAQEPEAFTVVYATSDDYFMNVRSQPSMKGQVVEKVYAMMHGLGNGVLRERGQKWSKVSVGNVTGWVYNKNMGTQSWYDGTGETVLIANRDNMTIYRETYVDDADYDFFATVKKGTILADDYDEIKDYYVLKTGHDYLFIKKQDAIVKKK